MRDYDGAITWYIELYLYLRMYVFSSLPFSQQYILALPVWSIHA